jgi:hypothetical protein
MGDTFAKEPGRPLRSVPGTGICAMRARARRRRRAMSQVVFFRRNEATSKTPENGVKIMYCRMVEYPSGKGGIVHDYGKGRPPSRPPSEIAMLAVWSVDYPECREGGDCRRIHRPERRLGDIIRFVGPYYGKKQRLTRHPRGVTESVRLGSSNSYLRPIVDVIGGKMTTGDTHVRNCRDTAI